LAESAHFIDELVAGPFDQRRIIAHQIKFNVAAAPPLEKFNWPSGTWLRIGSMLCSHSFWLNLRSERGTRLTYTFATRISPSSPPTNSMTFLTSGDLRSRAVAAAATRDVSSRVPPGGSSMSSAELAKSSGEETPGE